MPRWRSGHAVDCRSTFIPVRFRALALSPVVIKKCQCGGKATQLTADQHNPVRFRALAFVNEVPLKHLDDTKLLKKEKFISAENGISTQWMRDFHEYQNPENI